MAIGKKKLEQKGPSVDEAMDAMNSSEKKLAVVTNKDAFVPLGDGTFKYKNFSLAPSGLMPTANVTDNDLKDLGEKLGQIGKTIQWWIGDWANLKSGEWGEKYQWLVDVCGLNEKTIRNYANVARKVQLSLRRDNLTFTHHTLVAKMSDAEQAKWLKLADENNLSVAELRSEIKGKNKLLPVKNEGFADMQKQINEWDKTVDNFDKQYQDKLFEMLLDLARKRGYID